MSMIMDLFGGKKAALRKESAQWWARVRQNDAEARSELITRNLAQERLRMRKDWSAFEEGDEIPGVISRNMVRAVTEEQYECEIDDLFDIDLTEAFGKELQAIGCAAFAQTALEKMVIPEGIQVIGPKAFWGCVFLREVEFPKSLVYIADDAFGACNRLTAPDFSKCHALKHIGDRAFSGCTNRDFDELRFPKRLRRIGAFAFTGCTSLVEVKFNRRLNELGYGAFSYCLHLESVRGLPGKKRLKLDPELEGVRCYEPYELTIARRFKNTPFAKEAKYNECFYPLSEGEDLQYGF